MIRPSTFLLAVAAALAALCAAAPSPLRAQMPPADRELRIYAGLHAAAAIGDVAEIEKLIKEGENPNLQDSNSRTPFQTRLPWLCLNTQCWARSHSIPPRGGNSSQPWAGLW